MSDATLKAAALRALHERDSERFVLSRFGVCPEPHEPPSLIEQLEAEMQQVRSGIDSSIRRLSEMGIRLRMLKRNAEMADAKWGDTDDE